MKTKTKKQEKRDAVLIASFYAAVALAVIAFNLVTYLIDTI